MAFSLAYSVAWTSLAVAVVAGESLQRRTFRDSRTGLTNWMRSLCDIWALLSASDLGLVMASLSCEFSDRFSSVLTVSAPGNDLDWYPNRWGAFQRTLGKVIRDHFPGISGVARIVLAAELCLCVFDCW